MTSHWLRDSLTCFEWCSVPQIFLFAPVAYDNIFKQLRCCVEGGCLRHPDASTLGNMFSDGDCTDGWQNLTNPAMRPTLPRRQVPITLINSGK